MKNPIEMIKTIKDLLGVELTQEVKASKVVLAQLKLENGTLLESEDFSKGNEVFILTEDEKVSLPIGKYQMEDGRTLSITEEGVIDSIEVEAEETPDEVEDKEEDMNEEKYPTKEEFDALKEMVMGMKEMLEPKKEKEEDVEEELKAELSKPAVAPIKHNPEKKSSKKVLYSQKRGTSTLDIVMQKILNK